MAQVCGEVILELFRPELPTQPPVIVLFTFRLPLTFLKRSVSIPLYKIPLRSYNPSFLGPAYSLRLAWRILKTLRESERKNQKRIMVTVGLSCSLNFRPSIMRVGTKWSRVGGCHATATWTPHSVPVSFQLVWWVVWNLKHTLLVLREFYSTILPSFERFFQDKWVIET